MPDFLVFSALGPKLLGAKVILDVHDLMPELYASKFGLPESHWIIRALKWVERLSVRFADAAVAVHQPHLDALVAHGNPADKFTIVMNLPDPDMFRPARWSSMRRRTSRSSITGWWAPATGWTWRSAPPRWSRMRSRV